MKKYKQKYKKWWMKQKHLGCNDKPDCACVYDWELDWDNYVEGFLKQIRKSARL